MAGLVKDKATAFINELGGQVNNKILCKSSSHDIAGPKKKHVDCKFARSSAHVLRRTCVAQATPLFGEYQYLLLYALKGDANRTSR